MNSRLPCPTLPCPVLLGRSDPFVSAVRVAPRRSGHRRTGRGREAEARGLEGRGRRRRPEEHVDRRLPARPHARTRAPRPARIRIPSTGTRRMFPRRPPAPRPPLAPDRIQDWASARLASPSPMRPPWSCPLTCPLSGPLRPSEHLTHSPPEPPPTPPRILTSTPTPAPHFPRSLLSRRSLPSRGWVGRRWAPYLLTGAVGALAAADARSLDSRPEDRNLNLMRGYIRRTVKPRSASADRAIRPSHPRHARRVECIPEAAHEHGKNGIRSYGGVVVVVVVVVVVNKCIHYTASS